MRKTIHLLWSSSKTSKRKVSKRAGLFLLLILFQIATFAQEAIEISGIVTDQEKKEPLIGVTVNSKGTVTGTSTSNEGLFVLKTKQKLPYCTWITRQINSL